MKIYIPVLHIDRDGYIMYGAYDTKSKAESAIKDEIDEWTVPEVFELELNKKERI